MHVSIPINQGDSTYSWCRRVVAQFRPALDKYDEIYRGIHQNPELSMVESETAKLAKTHLQDLGFDQVLSGIGGHGVVGILYNGSGPVVMLRADMDALPIEEETGLPYASRKHQIDRNGEEKPVMHACGHDFHVTCLMAAADLLYSARSTWAGTLICLFQPGEEDGAGATAMVKDGIFDRIPKPDVIFGQHVTPSKSGTVQISSGPHLSACDCFDVRLFGKGGHGSAPHRCIDPVLAACSIVLRLQGIVSREVDPAEFAVVTCVYIRTAQAVNIIPDTVDMKVDVRTYKSEVRARVTAAVKRIINAESDASGLLQKPEIKHTSDIPPVTNDEEVVHKLRGAFGAHFPGALQNGTPNTASDDFSVLGEALGVPYAYWNIGGTDPEVWDRAVKEGKLAELPANHMANFGPTIEPTVKTGTDALALAALVFLKQKTG